jgi:hypothetical protein
MTTLAPERVGPVAQVSELVATGTVDTVYRDLYVQRARTLMSGVLSIDEYRRIEQEKADLATLPVMIGRAVEKSDWARVKELSSRGDALRRSVEGKQDQLRTARDVYVITDVRLDPFSPGLLAFTGSAAKDLAALRTQAVEHLTSLERADAQWKDFYAKRRAALQGLAVTVSESATAAASMDPHEAAQRALKAGDMRGLAQLAETFIAAATPAKDSTTSPKKTERPAAVSKDASTDLLTRFSDETLQASRRLGLAARRLEPKTEFASLRQYAWNPVFADESGRIGVKQVPLPTGTPEGFRDRLEMLMIHPLINSGGARHLPKLVAEDVLIEDFPDPKEGDEAPTSELLTILGLQGRRGLSRIAIEQALLDRGSDVLDKQLRLDPRVFRLVCIPPDVHLRLGEAEGWGRQPGWTHFDGYLVMADARLRALAGGEARFGGLFNLVGISRDYDSDRVMARFAVVPRERMSAW